MTSEDEEKASEHIVAHLFHAAGIKRVVYVDDVYAATIDTFLKTLAGLDGEQRSAVFDEAKGELDEEDVWQQRVRDRWEQLDDAEHASLIDKAYAISGGAEPAGIGAIHALRALLPSDMDQKGLSLAQWRAQREGLIGEIEAVPTLFLFDQDFSHEGGASADGQRMIAELEQALSGLEARSNAYYGLLTNTVGIDGEQDRRAAIVEHSAVDDARLVVISKRNLDDHELGRFAERLRITLLAPIFADLIEEVTGKLKETQKAAIDLAKKVSPEDMEHMVVRASDREGEWAPDTLVRILEAMERIQIREQLRVDKRVGELTQRLQRIAAIASSVQPDTAQASAMSSASVRPVSRPAAVRILRAETYDQAEHINALNLPIELGDLFERRSDKRLWVVIAQPCSLMVRRKGKREPELTHVILAKVEQQTEDSEADLFRLFELPYYFDEGAKSGVVRLSLPAFVRSIVLDSCVLNEDGHARLDLKAPTPAHLLPHWRTRHDELKKVGRILLDRSAPPKVSLSAEAVTGHYKFDVFPPTEVDREACRIEWDCRRIGRVGNPYASSFANALQPVLRARRVSE